MLYSLKGTVVLFGGAGYIGSNLAVGLRNNYRIVVIDKTPKPDWFNRTMYADALYVQVNLIHPPSITGIQLPLSTENNYAIILAARKDVVEGEELPYEYVRDNLALTVNCLEYCERWGIKNIIISSSSTVYHTATSAENHRHCFNECDSTSENPLGVYGYTKKVTEELVKVLTEKKEDVRVVILRYANPVSSCTEYPLFPTVGVMTVLAKRPAEFIQRGECFRDYINIRDVIEMHRLLMSEWNDKIHPGRQPTILNIGTGKPTRIDELIEIFMQVNEEEKLPHNITITRSSKNDFEPFTNCVDVTKFKILFPEWCPRFSVKESVRDYVRMFSLSQPLL